MTVTPLNFLLSFFPFPCCHRKDRARLINDRNYSAGFFFGLSARHVVFKTADDNYKRADDKKNLAIR